VAYERWDVVAIDFPFLEGTDSKRRPALVVSSDRLRQDFGLYWVVMITTAKTQRRKDDILLTNRERAGLPQDCVIRVSRIAVISEELISRRIGDIVPKDRNAVQGLLRRYLP
jgi:mRNA interferase MazF